MYVKKSEITINVCEKHSPNVDYKDNKNQDKNNDNCDYFTVDFTILNLGIFDTSCNKKERYIKYNFIHIVFKYVNFFFTYINTYILFLIMRVLQNSIEDQNYLEEVVKPKSIMVGL